MSDTIMSSDVTISERIRNPMIMNKLMTADEAVQFIRDGMTLGISGFTRAGDVKEIPGALVRRIQRTSESMRLNVWSGASVAEEVDQILTEAGVIARRLPFQADRTLRNSINAGDVMFTDLHLSDVADQLHDGHIQAVDLAIVEAVAITEEGGIVPSTSVGNSPIFARQASQIIVELNLSQPLQLEGIHDIYLPDNGGKRRPVPLVRAKDRIGLPYIPVDPNKIVAIVLTNGHDHANKIIPPADDTNRIARHVLLLLEKEVEEGRLPNPLPPLQAGVGCVANAVLHGLKDSPFEPIQMYSEVLQDSVFELIDAGKLAFASACSITLSPDRLEDILARFEEYKPYLMLRPQDISNHPDIIRRLGVIAINTAIEIDIYGNVNSTHIMGSQMMNGIGGSSDFAHHAALSVFVTPSTVKNGKISCIVPMVSHVDHTEHDVDIVVTEQGLADLRGLAPRERAERIISNCVHPDYRAFMMEYFEEAKQAGGHTPHVLARAFELHQRYLESGTMQSDKPRS